MRAIHLSVRVAPVRGALSHGDHYYHYYYACSVCHDVSQLFERTQRLTSLRFGDVADVVECGEGLGVPACGELEQCNNVPGSYHCTCNTGYTRLGGQCTGRGFGRSHHLTSPQSHDLASPHLISPHLTSPHLTSPHLTPPHLTSPHLTSLHLTPPHPTSPRLASPYLTSPHPTSPHLASPHLTPPHLTSPHLSSPQSRDRLAGS